MRPQTLHGSIVSLQASIVSIQASIVSIHGSKVSLHGFILGLNIRSAFTLDPAFAFDADPALNSTFDSDRNPDSDPNLAS
jgi:hypothetical protein